MASGRDSGCRRGHRSRAVPIRSGILRAAVDGWGGVADGGRRGFAAGREVVLAPTEYEWGIRRVGGTMFRSGTRLFLAFLKRRWDALV